MSTRLRLAFVALPYLYCLAVLWAIEDTSEANFTPQISIAVGLLLAVISTVVLVYFVHHIAETIHADNLIARIGHELETGIDRLFPEASDSPKKGLCHRTKTGSSQ